jgi:hypothetical protein
MEIELRFILLNLIPNGIPLIAWIVAIVLAIRMFRQNNERAEKFLLIGVSLMLANSFTGIIFNVLNPWIVAWVHDAGRRAQDLGIVFSIIGAFRGFIALAGIVYLVLAFWKRFKASA